MTALVIVLAIVLAVTNMLTLTALVLARRRAQYRRAVTLAAPDPALDAVLAAAPSPTGTVGTAGTRRIIGIEILNPIELAGQRNRMFGIAGSFLPDLTRRLVYDQTARRLRDQLVEHHVVADVRVHTIPSRTDGATRIDRAARTDRTARSDGAARTYPAARTDAAVAAPALASPQDESALGQLPPQAHLDAQHDEVGLGAQDPPRPL